jgi:uncharacterized protein
VAPDSVIRLHSGATLDFNDPESSNFTIEDIAHGLANVCRYSGQCVRFYSVAEHSLLVSQISRSGFELAGLLHDAAEAFVGDVTGPLKKLVPEYKKIELRVQGAIFSRFGLPEEMPREVKEAELQVLAAEQAQIMPPGTSDWAVSAGIEPARIVVRHLTPPQARGLFLRRFDEVR